MATLDQLKQTELGVDNAGYEDEGLKKFLRPSVPSASMDRSGSLYGQIRPDLPPSLRQRSSPDPAAFTPDMSSGGSAGTGQTSQPPPPPTSGNARSVPPGVSAQPAPYQSPRPQAPTLPPASPVTPPPLPSAPPLSPQAQSAVQTLSTSPKSNWMQRLGLAVLSATRLAPYAQQLIHPKWSEQVAQANRTLEAELEAGKIGHEQAGAQAELARGQAELSRGQYLEESRRDAAEARVQSAQISADERDRERKLKGFEAYVGKDPVIYRQPGEAPPDGWDAVGLPHPDLPGMTPYVPGRNPTLTQELAPYAPGYQVGAGIPRDDFQKAADAYRKVLEEKSKVSGTPPNKDARDEDSAVKQIGAKVQGWSAPQGRLATIADLPLDRQAEAAKIRQDMGANPPQVLMVPQGGGPAMAARPGVNVPGNYLTPGAESKNVLDAKGLYKPATDAAERMNIMTQNYENAIRNHDQQAMVSLLFNHIGMTMGAQKGARMTRDVIHEAAQSLPWLDSVTKRFGPDGLLMGITLAPEQMRQMLSLGRERFGQEVAKAKSMADYSGVKDAGPAQVPSASTIRFYTALANGDPGKTAQLLQEDGWSVK